ncbi:MAG: hypothetical protein ABMB14_04930 [Myxococcota bacterium]
MVFAVLAIAAHAQTVDTRVQLYDGLLLDGRGDVEGAYARFTALSRTLSDDDPTLAEALYWQGYTAWELGRASEARAALLDGIRNGCPKCRDLLEQIELETAAVTTLPVSVSFDTGNHVLFHPWRVQELGTMQVSVSPRGDAALEWRTAPRPGEPDLLVLGFHAPQPTPETLRFDLQSVSLDAWIDVVAEDDRGRAFTLPAPIQVGRGVLRRIVVTFASLVPADGGAPLDPARLVLLSIVDRTEAHSLGSNTLWIDDLEVR